MTCASRHCAACPSSARRAASRRPAGRRRRRRTWDRAERAVGVHASGAAARSRGQGYFVQASSVARVRLSPTERAGASTVLASSRVSSRSVWALPSNPPHGLAQLGQHPLAVVAERRVAEVVGQRGGLGDVGLAARAPGTGRGRPGRPRGCGSAGCGRSRRSAARPPGSWRRAAATPRRARRGPGRARTACARARPPAWAAPRRGARAPRRRTGPGRPSQATLLPRRRRRRPGGRQ